MPETLKKKSIISLFFIFLAIVIGGVFLSIYLPMKIVVFNQAQNDIPVGEIYGEKKVGQTFVAEYSNLSAIELLLATYNRENTFEYIFQNLSWSKFQRIF